MGAASVSAFCTHGVFPKVSSSKICVHACVRACVRACVLACVRASSPSVPSSVPPSRPVSRRILVLASIMHTHAHFFGRRIHGTKICDRALQNPKPKTLKDAWKKFVTGPFKKVWITDSCPVQVKKAFSCTTRRISGFNLYGSVGCPVQVTPLACAYPTPYTPHPTPYTYNRCNRYSRFISPCVCRRS